jgi:hypothetical protein
MFGAQQGAAGYQNVFSGMLTEQDAWFTKWQPGGPTATAGTAAAPGLATAGRANSFAIGAVAGPTAKTLEIAEDELGHSMDSLFADYMRQAKVVTIEDSYLIQSHQVANLLRFCEMLVRLGTVQTITVVTKTEDQDSHARLDSIKSSLAGHGIGFTHTLLKTLHDRRIKTDTGWEINLGRGLDIYKKPEDWHGVGATDFALRPCYHTRIVYHRLGQISTP